MTRVNGSRVVNSCEYLENRSRALPFVSIRENAMSPEKRGWSIGEVSPGGPIRFRRVHIASAIIPKVLGVDFASALRTGSVEVDMERSPDPFTVNPHFGRTLELTEFLLVYSELQVRAESRTETSPTSSWCTYQTRAPESNDSNFRVSGFEPDRYLLSNSIYFI